VRTDGGRGRTLLSLELSRCSPIAELRQGTAGEVTDALPLVCAVQDVLGPQGCIGRPAKATECIIKLPQRLLGVLFKQETDGMRSELP
jgi:hypothetical protein